MKYKPGDEVLVKGAITDLHEGTDHPYFVAVNYDSVNWVSEDKIFPADKTYTQGLADAWELAKKILFKEYGYSAQQIYDIFGGGAMQTVKNLTIEEALAKLEAYEKEKEIKVGDVVYYGTDEYTSTQSIVTRIEGDVVYTVYADGSCGKEHYPSDLKKTGKHIDIESLLRQIGE